MKFYCVMIVFETSEQAFEEIDIYSRHSITFDSCGKKEYLTTSLVDALARKEELEYLHPYTSGKYEIFKLEKECYAHD